MSNNEHRQQIASTILAQLGGNQFLAMTGTKSVGIMESGIICKLGRFAGLKITHVRVTLTDTDLYDVDFLRVHGFNTTTISSFTGIYADMLRELFTEETGLETSLGTIRRA